MVAYRTSPNRYKVTYYVTKTARQAYYLATGIELPEEQHLEITTDTPEDRAWLEEMPELYYATHPARGNRLVQQRVSDAADRLTYRHPRLIEPTRADVQELYAAWQRWNTAICEIIEAARLSAVAEVIAEAQRVIDQANAAAAAFAEWDGAASAPRIPFWQPSIDGCLLLPDVIKAEVAAALQAARQADTAANRRIDQAKQAAKAARLAERAAWIEQHGSPRLRKALAAGYDMQRLYVQERAGLEWPGWTVDFDDRAGWKARSNPTEAALDLLAQTPDAEIVWLTIDADGEEIDPGCEIVVQYSYLGKYDLYKIV